MKYEDLVLLTTEKNIKTASLEYDENCMIKLNKNNAEKIKKLINEKTIKNYNIGKDKFNYFIEKKKSYKNFNTEDWIEIIKEIVIENSTRTSAKTIYTIANYINEDFFTRLKKVDSYLVDDMVDYLVKNDRERAKSICSKVCKYIAEWIGKDGDDFKYGYSINDYFIRTILPYYLAYYKDKIVTDINLKKIKFENISYNKLHTLLGDLISAIKIKNNEDINRDELDHIIWYFYRKDSIRVEIAKVLAVKLAK